MMGNCDNKQLTCQECKASFSTTSNLYRHLRRLHQLFPKGPTNNVCEHCGKGFVSIYSIKRHVCKSKKKTLKLRVKKENGVSCQICPETFSAPYIMYRHMRHIHQTKPKMSVSRRLQCALCDATLITHKAMDMHLCTEHNITLEIDKLKFDCLESFYVWKYQIEFEQHAHFIRRNAIGPNMYFYCQRSGNRLPEKKKQSQNKNVYKMNKSRSSIKMGKCCPARIVLKIEEGEMIVLFHKIHIGHRQFSNLQVIKNKEMSNVQCEKTQSSVENEETLSVKLKNDVIDDERQLLVTDMMEKIYGNLDSVRELILCAPPENLPFILEESEQFQQFVESLSLKADNMSSELDEIP